MRFRLLESLVRMLQLRLLIAQLRLLIAQLRLVGLLHRLDGLELLTRSLVRQAWRRRRRRSERRRPVRIGREPIAARALQRQASLRHLERHAAATTSDTLLWNQHVDRHAAAAEAPTATRTRRRRRKHLEGLAAAGAAGAAVDGGTGTSAGTGGRRSARSRLLRFGNLNDGRVRLVEGAQPRSARSRRHLAHHSVVLRRVDRARLEQLFGGATAAHV